MHIVAFSLMQVATRYQLLVRINIFRALGSREYFLLYSRYCAHPVHLWYTYAHSGQNNNIYSEFIYSVPVDLYQVLLVLLLKHKRNHWNVRHSQCETTFFVFKLHLMKSPANPSMVDAIFVLFNYCLLKNQLLWDSYGCRILLIILGSSLVVFVSVCVVTDSVTLPQTVGTLIGCSASHRQSLATIVCILLLSSQSVSLNVASILSAYWIIV